MLALGATTPQKLAEKTEKWFRVILGHPIYLYMGREPDFEPERVFPFANDFRGFVVQGVMTHFDDFRVDGV
jgi:hypothetical protein